MNNDKPLEGWLSYNELNEIIDLDDKEIFVCDGCNATLRLSGGAFCKWFKRWMDWWAFLFCSETCFYQFIDYAKTQAKKDSARSNRRKRELEQLAENHKGPPLKVISGGLPSLGKKR